MQLNFDTNESNKQKNYIIIKKKIIFVCLLDTCEKKEEDA